MVVVEVGTQPAVAEVLPETDVVQFFAVFIAGAEVTGIQIIAHGHVVLLREAIPGKGHLTVVFVEVFRIAQPVRSTAKCVLRQLRQSGPRLGNVKRQCPKGHQVPPYPQGQGFVITAFDTAAVNRPAVAHPPRSLTGDKHGPIGTVAEVRGATAADLVTHRPWPGQVGNAGSIDGKCLHAAILLFYPYIQLPGNGIVNVLNTERPRGDLGFIQHPALLGDHHFGVGSCHACHFGGITTQVRRQHAVIGDQADAGKAKAVKDVGIQEVFTQGKLRPKGRNSLVGVVAAPVPAIARALTIAPMIQPRLPVGT